jgi:hypothetical protein
MSIQQRYWGLSFAVKTEHACGLCKLGQPIEISEADIKNFPQLATLKCCQDCRTKLYLEQMKEDQRQAEGEERIEDRKRFVAGFTHKYIIWIHPDGGDDFAVEFYAKGEMAPSRLKTEVTKIKKKYKADHVEEPQIINLAEKYNWGRES